jgi:hypothetical protein
MCCGLQPNLKNLPKSPLFLNDDLFRSRNDHKETPFLRLPISISTCFKIAYIYVDIATEKEL